MGDVVGNIPFSEVPVPMYDDAVCAAWKAQCPLLRFEAAESPGHHMGLLTGQLYALWALEAPDSDLPEQVWQTFNEGALMSLLRTAAQQRKKFRHRFSNNDKTPATVTSKRPDFRPPSTMP